MLASTCLFLFFAIPNFTFGDLNNPISRGLCISHLISAQKFENLDHKIEDCQKKCSLEPRCKWFSYNQKKGTCHLTKTCSKVVFEEEKYSYFHKKREITGI